MAALLLAFGLLFVWYWYKAAMFNKEAVECEMMNERLDPSRQHRDWNERLAETKANLLEERRG